MRIKEIKDNVFTDYKKISMLIALPYCCGKCYKEVGKNKDMCHNEYLENVKIIDISNKCIIDRYKKNPLSKAIILGGREPFYKSFEEVYNFVKEFREMSSDDIVIYTGYYENEIADMLNKLKEFNNIIIKFGRYNPNKPPKKERDILLGVILASNNQYSERIEDI